MTQSSLAVVFPGQGSQKVGMLAELANSFEQVNAAFYEASEVLGYDLWDLAQNGSQEDVNQTERTQPLLLTASVALWRIWCEQGGVQPAYLSGHSLGEWSALVCAGVVDFPAAVKLVQQRGKFMQEAVPAGQGAMAAIIGLADSEIIKACEDAAQGAVVAPVNFNSPGQVVIAGESAAVERAMAACKDAGAKRALPLPVSAPFHTSLMRPAAERLEAQIQATEFRAPQIPVVHNVTARTEANPETIKVLMVEQIYSPVRWVECVRELRARGVVTTLECGPGKVLSGLSKRIDKELTTLAIETPDELRATIEAARS
jgi:[acyl-carrier-protein] S-malonyltransferase